MAAKNKPDAKEPETTERKFSKAQLLKSAQYQDQRDLLCALLKDDQRYSLIEVSKRVQEFLKKEM